MAGLERQFGKPIEQIVAEAYTEHGTMKRAAASLGVDLRTYSGWVQRMPIEVRRVATVKQQVA